MRTKLFTSEAFGAVYLERRRTRVDVDPPIDVFQVVVASEQAPDGSRGRRDGLGVMWPETFGSEAEASAFLRGFKVALAFTEVGFVFGIPERWRNP